jgi:ribonuclease Z
MGMHQRKKPLVVWAPESVIEWLQTTIRLTDLYLPFPVEFLATETVEHFDFSETLTLSTVELRHRVPSHAFAFDATSEKRHLDPAKLAALGVPQGKLWRKLQNGVAIECGGKSISPDEAGFLETRRCRAVVGGDNADPALIAPVSKGLDVLMHEATYSQAVAEKVGEAPMHSSVAAVAKFAESAGIPNLVLTHFSARHHAPAAMAALEAEAKQFYSGTLFMAEDGMRLRLNEKKILEKL